MKQESPLRNNLKAIRTRLGLSQQELADLAGVTRQNISGVESGQYAPSTTLSLKIARALGCRVEDLFWLDSESPSVLATPARGVPVGAATRLALAKVGGRWVAHPLSGASAFRTELIPADGDGLLEPGADQLQVRLLDNPESLLQTVVIAGCTPSLSLWARAAERWHPGLRVHWVFANSTEALGALARGEIHAAGLHLYDPETGEHNTPFVQKALSGRPTVLINLGIWEEGLLLAPGNPKSIQGPADLGRADVTLVNREPGAGARQLLERVLNQSGIPADQVRGFDRTLGGHLEVAQAVAEGTADAGVSTASVAAAYGLDFLPLHRGRYDIVVLREYMEEQPVRQLLATLSHRSVRAQLEALGSYDTSQTGEVVGVTE